MKYKDKTEFTIDIIYSKLNNVISQLEEIKSQIPEHDREKWEFEWNYSNCWYESDTPSIVLKKNK